MRRTALAATVTLPLLAGCAAAPQPTAVPPAAADKARVIFYTAADYRPVIAHGVRLNETDVGRLNGPNQVVIREVAPGSHVADMIRAGMFASKAPLSVMQRDLQAGETWYLRVTEYGVNCRIVSDVETLVMSGIAGLIASKVIDGRERRQCDSFTPDLWSAPQETGVAEVNQIVYGLADPKSQLASANASTATGNAVGAPPALDQVKAEWPLLEKIVARQAENSIVLVEGEFDATTNSLRIYKYEPLETRAGSAADEFGVVVRLHAQLQRSGSLARTSGVRDLLFQLKAADGSVVAVAPPVRPPLAANISSVQVAGISRDRASVEAEWPTLEKALRRHFERNTAAYEGIFEATPNTMQVYSFALVDTMQGIQPGQYRIMSRVTAGYIREGSRARMSGVRDIMFDMHGAEDGVAVQSVTHARAR